MEFSLTEEEGGGNIAFFPFLMPFVNRISRTFATGVLEAFEAQKLWEDQFS